MEKKTATSSLLEMYEKESLPLPQKTTQSCIQDSKNTPRCIVEITEMTILPFSEVTEDFAKCEGEGDLSLEYWRKAHKEFFSQYSPNFHEHSKVVCERFKVLQIL